MESTTLKRRIFIGSSSEQLSIAEAIKKEFQDEFDITIWSEGFFCANDYVFPKLLVRLLTYDYAIMIGGLDDEVIRLRDGAKRYSPRDNVYIEYGLFSGCMAPNRVLMLKHRECTEASDLRGKLFEEYKNTEEAVSATRKWLESQEQNNFRGINKFTRNDIDLLPTIGIAVGYYHNFVESICGILGDITSVTVSGTDYPVSQKAVKICIPHRDFIAQSPDFTIDTLKNILKSRRPLVESSIVKPGMNRPFWIIADTDELKQGRLVIYDVPPTLLGVLQTVDFIYNGYDYPEVENDIICAKSRAMDSFYNIIRQASSKNANVKQYIEVERIL